MSQTPQIRRSLHDHARELCSPEGCVVLCNRNCQATLSTSAILHSNPKRLFSCATTAHYRPASPVQAPLAAVYAQSLELALFPRTELAFFAPRPRDIFWRHFFAPFFATRSRATLSRHVLAPLSRAIALRLRVDLLYLLSRPLLPPYSRRDFVLLRAVSEDVALGDFMLTFKEGKYAATELDADSHAVMEAAQAKPKSGNGESSGGAVRSQACAS
eukprot:2655274-Pleurochrysis_carterae.AAC.1